MGANDSKTLSSAGPLGAQARREREQLLQQAKSAGPIGQAARRELEKK